MKQIATILLLWIAGIVAGAQFSKLTLVIDTLQTSFNIDAIYAGWLISSLGIVGIIFGATAGIIAGRFNPIKMVVYTLFFAAFISILQVQISDVTSLLSIRILEGFTQLLLVTAAPTGMLQVVSKKYQSQAMALWGTFFGVAFVLTNAFGPAIIEVWQWQGVFYCHAILATTTATLLVFIAPKSSVSITTNDPFTLSNFLTRHIKVYTNLGSALPGFLFFAHTLIFLVFLTFLPQLFKTTFPDKTQLLHWLNIGLPLVSLIGTFLSGMIIRLTGKSPLNVIMVMFICIGSLLASSLFIKTAALLFLFLIFILFCVGAIQGLIFITIPFLSSDQGTHAYANGAVSQMGNAGATIGVPIFTTILVNSNWYFAILFPVVCCTFGLLIAFLGKCKANL